MEKGWRKGGGVGFFFFFRLYCFFERCGEEER